MMYKKKIWFIKEQQDNPLQEVLKGQYSSVEGYYKAVSKQA